MPGRSVDSRRERFLLPFLSARFATCARTSANGRSDIIKKDQQTRGGGQNLSNRRRFDYVGSPRPEARLDRRTTLTFPLSPPLQNERIAAVGLEPGHAHSRRYLEFLQHLSREHRTNASALAPPRAAPALHQAHLPLAQPKRPVRWSTIQATERNGAFAPFVRPTPQSDPWRHDRGRIVS